ncbi:hypothetical protein GBL_3535 [Geobacillus kaustophilus GBlys]|uniref:Uncharacterized protein n=1 Tax=Geobacillus kaustophilus GBlys TaxID=1337888 RepID=U2YDX8_GEOKU|nr:hypothetical protein GBL_3535 [Geobacillus kaustophilus GBlys]
MAFERWRTLKRIRRLDVLLEEGMALAKIVKKCDPTVHLTQ